MSTRIAAAVVGAAVYGLAGCQAEVPTDAPGSDAGPSPTRLLATLGGGDFPRVITPWRFRFPADHGPHARYRTEWWHLTGVLGDGDDQPVGVQLYLVRIGLGTPRGDRASRWAATDVYSGLLTVSGPGTETARTHVRVSRGALGLAGARRRPPTVWIGDWRLKRTAEGPPSGAKLRVAEGDLVLTLDLDSTRPLVDANDVAPTDSEPAAPFVFYVQPRLSASGTLTTGERRRDLTGSVSLEHSWGELPLPGGPVARDRLTLYLEDGRQLFCVRTHRVDGSGTPATTGLLIERNGSPRALSDQEIELKPVGYWESGRSGARYPVRWSLKVPGRGIELELAPFREDQETTGWAPLWSGPVRARTPGGETAGLGLAQLYGYEG